jgi:ATP-dependent helicase HepA
MDLSAILNETAQATCEALESMLPQLKDDWWAGCVLGKLSYQQREHVDRRGLTALQRLDLAALLRVVDGNWYDLSHQFSWPYEGRNFVKEMQTVRNRWAHKEIAEPAPADVYRDLDTICRFLRLLAKDSTAAKRAEEAREQALLGPTDPPAVTHTEPEEAALPQFHFSVGDVVHLRDDPLESGAITAVDTAGAEPTYQVFVDGKVRPFFESQLSAKEKSPDFVPIGPDTLRSLLTATQLLHPSAQSLQSLHSARIDFVPYQYLPALKLIRADQPRLLIADSVGVGKTIEAGLVLRELQARREVNSVLVICPKALVTERKWHSELKRFDEDFVHLDGKLLRHCIEETDLDGEWPARYDRAIVPFSVLTEEALFGSKRTMGFTRLDPPPQFDLVIVDEAHHIRNTDTLRHSAVRFLCQNAGAVLFLTATPIQLGEKDLFVLLNTLRPDVFFDMASFSTITSPNPHINEAASAAREGTAGWPDRAADALDDAAITEWGKSVLQQDPRFQEVLDSLKDMSDQRQDRVSAIEAIEGLHTLTPFMTRTLRRDIGEFTTRKAHTVAVEFTAEQEKLYNAIISLHAEHYRRLHGDGSVAFFLTTVRRQAASCLAGLAPMLHDILAKRFTDLDWAGADGAEAPPTDSSIAGLVAEVLSIAETVSYDPEDDPKFRELKKVLEAKQSMRNNRVMIFSSFRHTLAFLERGLRDLGLRVGVIHGGIPDEERRLVRAQFAAPRADNAAVDILLFSDVGSEGLDYQFCNCMVNYDLPWNPMRVDQRIGRIDRRGQTADAVAIYNLIVEGTIDAEIYRRCLLRIGVFESALGANEVILGEITKKIQNVGDDLSLSLEERSTRLEQIADNAIRNILKQEELEVSQAELFGLRVPQTRFEEAVQAATSRWLTPEAISHLVATFTQKVSGTETAPIHESSSGTVLRLNREARTKMLRASAQKGARKTPTSRAWRQWLEGNDPTLPIVFDSEAARDRSEATLMTSMHPLVRTAAEELHALAPDRPYTGLEIDSTELPVGVHPFVVYHWEYRGVTNDSRFAVVARDMAVSAQLLDLLPDCRPVGTGEVMAGDDDWVVLAETHHAMWADARAEHFERVTVAARFRVASLRTSHQARLELLGQQISQATSSKIITMRESELERARRDFEHRIADLESAADRADIRAAPLAFGVLRVTPVASPKGQT